MIFLFPSALSFSFFAEILLSFLKKQFLRVSKSEEDRDDDEAEEKSDSKRIPSFV